VVKCLDLYAKRPIYWPDLSKNSFVDEELAVMIVRVPDIPAEGLSVTDATALGSVYRDPAWRLLDVNVKLERDGSDVSQACGRCLEPSPAEVTATLDVRLVPRPTTADNVELAPDDLDVDFYDRDEIDIGALIEAETTLALPMKPLCREGCLGLCRVCGGNRNVVQCECRERPPDPRLAALKDLASRLSH
jgi:uncharacterized metal-binding protein YceD (DUF177 family)